MKRDEAELPLLEVLHEHPTWFLPLFRELEREGIPFRAVEVGDLEYSAVAPHAGSDTPAVEPAPVVFNRMSPSAYLRGGASGIRFALHYLEALEAVGTRTINGSRAFRTELSKSRQLGILAQLGLSAPRTRIAHSPQGIRGAAEAVGFPLILKPNVGGSGAGIIRVDGPEELEAGIGLLAADTAALQVDSTVLVQEYVAPRGNSIVRVEVVGGEFLYAIRIHLTDDTFNLCPADVCQSTGGEVLIREACPVDAPRNGLQVEGFIPPPEVVGQVERIVEAAGMEMGGVEYLEREGSGEVVYYDVNALSNFVADPLRVLGFDPTPRLVGYLRRVLVEKGARVAPVGGAS